MTPQLSELKKGLTGQADVCFCCRSKNVMGDAGKSVKLFFNILNP